MILAACYKGNDSVNLEFRCDMDEKTAEFAVKISLDGTFECLKYTDFEQAVDKYKETAEIIEKRG